MSSIFVAVAYDDMYQAQEVRLRLLRMHQPILRARRASLPMDWACVKRFAKMVSACQ